MSRAFRLNASLISQYNECLAGRSRGLPVDRARVPVSRSLGFFELTSRSSRSSMVFSLQPARGECSGHLARRGHWLGGRREAGNRRRNGGHRIDHDRALGIATGHHPGVRTVRGRVLDVSARVTGTGGGGVGEVLGGGVVHPVHPDGPRAELRAQRSTNACPTPPTPGGSVVARANTTSTSGQEAAAAGEGKLAAEFSSVRLNAAAGAPPRSGPSAIALRRAHSG